MADERLVKGGRLSGGGKKIVLGFSGGVDSAVAALLLQRRGCKVIPVVLDLGGADAPFLLDRAARTAALLGLELMIEPGKEIFFREVVRNLLDDYRHARTPNPCLRCNARVKFALLARVAERIQADGLATGHYLRRWANPGETEISWHQARDKGKDQSYFLQAVPSAWLRRCLFPLGELSKSEVLRLAREAGYELTGYRESQELCFLQGEKYQDFLLRQGLVGVPGEITSLDGSFLGRHRGLQNYTIGQRRGLGVASREPLYVCALDFTRNRLQVGTREQALRQSFQVASVNWLLPFPDAPLPLECQIRYRHRPALATLTPLPENRARIDFVTPQFAVTPGQGAAFYAGDRLLGGGTIE
ncbi:MAG: tRNA 2-thiouridine(34) synthase MnmA [Deltaproteobacteria bacterium]|nr:tRNA 2-thiouridine(34) synthase MnmA [Deltaproteobacteria bacterium]